MGCEDCNRLYMKVEGGICVNCNQIYGSKNLVESTIKTKSLPTCYILTRAVEKRYELGEMYEEVIDGSV